MMSWVRAKIKIPIPALQEERAKLRLGEPRPPGASADAFERQVDQAVAAAEESLYARGEGEGGDTEGEETEGELHL